MTGFNAAEHLSHGLRSATRFLRTSRTPHDGDFEQLFETASVLADFPNIALRWRLDRLACTIQLLDNALLQSNITSFQKEGDRHRQLFRQHILNPSLSGTEDLSHSKLLEDFLSGFGVAGIKVLDHITFCELNDALSNCSNLLSPLFWRRFSTALDAGLRDALVLLAKGVWSEHALDRETGRLCLQPKTLPDELKDLQAEFPEGIYDHILIERNTRKYRPVRLKWLFEPDSRIWLPVVSQHQGELKLNCTLSGKKLVRVGDTPKREELASLHAAYGLIVTTTTVSPVGKMVFYSDPEPRFDGKFIRKSAANQLVVAAITDEGFADSIRIPILDEVELVRRIRHFAFGQKPVTHAAKIQVEGAAIRRVIEKEKHGWLENIPVVEFIRAKRSDKGKKRKKTKLGYLYPLEAGMSHVPRQSCFSVPHELVGKSGRCYYDAHGVIVYVEVSSGNEVLYYHYLKSVGIYNQHKELIRNVGAFSADVTFDYINTAMGFAPSGGYVGVTHLPIKQMPRYQRWEVNVGSYEIFIPREFMPVNTTSGLCAQFFFNSKGGCTSPVSLQIGTYTGAPQPFSEEHLEFIASHDFGLRLAGSSTQSYVCVRDKETTSVGISAFFSAGSQPPMWSPNNHGSSHPLRVPDFAYPSAESN